MSHRTEAVVVLPHLGPGGSQKVASILLNAWHADGKRVTLVSLLDGPADAHHLDAGIEHLRIQDVLRRERSEAGTSARMAVHRLALPLRLPRLVGRHAARVFALVGFDLCAMVVHAVSPLLGPERYLTLFYPDTWRDIRCLRRLFLELRPDIVISFLAATNVKTIFAARQIRQPVLISERNDPAGQKISEPWQYFRERAYQWVTLVTANPAP